MASRGRKTVVFNYIKFSKFHTHNGDDTIPRRVRKERFPLYKEEEYEINLFLKYKYTPRLIEKFFEQ